MSTNLTSIILYYSFLFLCGNLASTLEEGRTASTSPHKKFGYFLSISQQAVSADITKNSSVGNNMQYLNHDYTHYSTRKGFEECVREETAL
jgi:hypothetical protein